MVQAHVILILMAGSQMNCFEKQSLREIERMLEEFDVLLVLTSAPEGSYPSLQEPSEGNS